MPVSPIVVQPVWSPIPDFPNPGDKVFVNELRATHAATIDRTLFIQDAIGLASNSARVLLTQGRSGTASPTWENQGYFVDQSSLTAPIWICDLNFPHSVNNAWRINYARLWLKGAGSHVGLPAVMPTMSLIRVLDDGSPTALSSGTDSSANVGAYETRHELEILPNAIVNNSAKHFLQITGEGSTNALVGLQLSDLYIGWSLV